VERAHISSVDIVFDETVDAQSRAAYYDKSAPCGTWSRTTCSRC
jgi:glucose-6-phosphate 1-dehydrogenase